MHIHTRAAAVSLATLALLLPLRAVAFDEEAATTRAAFPGTQGDAFEATLPGPAKETLSHQASDLDASFGRVISETELASQRGGDLHLNDNNATGNVQDNVARNLTTGNNTITESAFANTAGIPMVIQNSGNNVLIQNSTILNLQLQ